MNKYEALLKSKMEEHSFNKLTALGNDKVMDFSVLSTLQDQDNNPH